MLLETKYLTAPSLQARHGLLHKNLLTHDKVDIALSTTLGQTIGMNRLVLAPTTAKQEPAYTIKKGSNMKIGSTAVTITDPYGIRNFKGRQGKHSTGIDMVTSTGKAVALADGVIESVKIDGGAKILKPTEGAAAGYYVRVRNADGSKSEYMHLNPMTQQDMQKLVGKKLKRGDTIWGYDKGSGSMTAPHVKVRFYAGDNPLTSHVDPTKYLLNTNLR